MVTDEHWVEVLATWGARAIVVHEAPPMWSVAPARVPGERPVVLFVGTFGGDEPIEVVFDAARACPELDLRVTGDPRRCPSDILARVPENVALTGFLGPSDYTKAVEEADIILTLSTEPTSVMRAACEAVYVGRPLVVSDWPGLRKLFPYAITVANSPESIARGLRRAITEHSRLREQLVAARNVQEQRWDLQLTELRRVLDLAGARPKDVNQRRNSLLPATSSGSESPSRDAGSDESEIVHGIKRYRIAGLPTTLVGWEEVDAWSSSCIDAGKSATLCTIAPYQAYLYLHDVEYHRCLDRADVILVDGNGIRILLGATGHDAGPRMTGRELVERIFDGRLLGGRKVAVVGGLEATHARLAVERPEWQLIGGVLSARPVDSEVRAVAEQLEEQQANVVIVALGSPKMELWADALSRMYPAVYLSTGGAVDTVVGVRQAPPTIITSLYLEFAWRALQDRALVPRLARGLAVMPRLLVRALFENR